MISRGQVFVQAQDDSGRWGNADVFDLDDESFRAWVVWVFITKVGCIQMEMPPRDDIVLKTKVPFPEGS